MPAPPDRLPKVLLHEHLDGGLRPATLLALGRARGLQLPADDPESLARWMHGQADAGSLELYLRGFALTVAAMATPQACEQVAFEAAEDARADGCVLAEFRMAPLLLEPEGLAPEPAVEAMLAGLARSGLDCGLVVCAMRHEPPERSLRAARLAARYAGQGVVGFDLAGAERGFPPGAHRAAFDLAAQAGLGLTCHAGEADDGDRVLEAAALGARRIGHGVHLVLGDPARVRERTDAARALGLHFEVCPSSNVHTGVVPSLAQHPIRAMVDAGLSVSCSTDNRLMSGVTLTGELRALRQHCGFSAAALQALMRAGAQASFLPEAARQRALAAIDAAA